MTTLPKRARIKWFRTAVFLNLLILTGCPQPVKPPVTEITNNTSPFIASYEQEPPEEKNPVQQEKRVESERFDWNENLRVLTETTVGAENPKGHNQLDNEITALGQAFTVSPIDETYVRISPLESIAKQIELGNAKHALQAIFQLESSIPEDERARLLNLKAKVFRALDMDIAALRIDAEIITLLDDSQKKAALDRVLLHIAKLPAQIQDDLSQGTDALAGCAAAYRAMNDPSNNALGRFIRRFRGHPIFQSLSRLEPITTSEREIAFQITALLPLSGDLANAGRAIRDGLLFSASQTQANRRIKLRVLDSETLSNRELARIASGEATEFVIGPLKKSNVERVLAAQPRIPVLVLNRLKKEASALTSQVYSLSLAIEDDARSALAQAKRKAEEPRILTMHANQNLGHRVALELDSIAYEFDGTIAGHFAINSVKPEETVSQALGVTDSNNRRRALSKLLDLKLAHTPRIREDMTAIIVQTNAKQARQLRPLLDFYYLDSTPVFLIGAYRNDLIDVSEDFKNSHLLASPWEIGNDLSAALKARPLSAGILGPLSAVGMDALAVSMRLGFGESVEFMGQSGYLRLQPTGIIERQLSLLSVGSNESITIDLWEPPARISKDSEVSDAR